MTHYESLDQEGRIEYANKIVPSETIVEYQNEIGKTMFENNPIHVDGFPGKHKKEVDLKLQVNGNYSLMSVVDERNVHVSTYDVKLDKLERIVLEDKFWIWQDRNF